MGVIKPLSILFHHGAFALESLVARIAKSERWVDIEMAIESRTFLQIPAFCKISNFALLETLLSFSRSVSRSTLFAFALLLAFCAFAPLATVIIYPTFTCMKITVFLPFFANHRNHHRLHVSSQTPKATMDPSRYQTGLLKPFVYKSDDFTKTGSGQTQGKLKKRPVVRQ